MHNSLKKTLTPGQLDEQIYNPPAMAEATEPNCQQFHHRIFDALETEDSQIHSLIAAEYQRQQNCIQLIAAENQCSKAVLAALGCVVQNKTTEGFAGSRYHGGCDVVDEIERLAIDRAKQAFTAEYANVQPHSGTQANQIVFTAILERDDRILSFGLDQGGHVSHGANVSFTGKFFEIEHYGVDRDSFLLDYDDIERLAIKVKPKMIVCGATAYSRVIDFARFRRIADKVGAYLLADISHISGLVIAGVHPSPIDHAHFTTTSTYKPGGPRGGLILMGKDFNSEIKINGRAATLHRIINKATFPGVQGTPYLNNIAAKAVFLRETLTDEYKNRQFEITLNAETLANCFASSGYDVLTGGTDNHMILINVSNLRDALTGVVAQNALEQCGIIVNMNKLPFDTKPATVTSGIRLGTPIVTKNGMGADEMQQIYEMIDTILRNVEIINDREHRLAEPLARQVKTRAEKLCGRFRAFV